MVEVEDKTSKAKSLQEVKRKLNNFVRYQLLWYMVRFLTQFIDAIFRRLKNTDAQCIIGFLVPGAKKITYLAFSKVVRKMVGTENEKANVLLTVTINVSFGLFIAIVLIGARITTMICTMIVEFLVQLNLYHTPSESNFLK